jgi:hypothetical protein
MLPVTDARMRSTYKGPRTISSTWLAPTARVKGGSSRPHEMVRWGGPLTRVVALGEVDEMVRAPAPAGT